MPWIATAMQGRYLPCPCGGRMAMYVDQERYVHSLIDFIHVVDAGRFDMAMGAYKTDHPLMSLV